MVDDNSQYIVTKHCYTTEMHQLVDVIMMVADVLVPKAPGHQQPSWLPNPAWEKSGGQKGSFRVWVRPMSECIA